MLRASSLGISQVRVHQHHLSHNSLVHLAQTSISYASNVPNTPGRANLHTQAHVHTLLRQSLRQRKCLRADTGQEEKEQKRLWSSTSAAYKRMDTMARMDTRSMTNTQTRVGTSVGTASADTQKITQKGTQAQRTKDPPLSGPARLGLKRVDGKWVGARDGVNVQSHRPKSRSQSQTGRKSADSENMHRLRVVATKGRSLVDIGSGPGSRSGSTTISGTRHRSPNSRTNSASGDVNDSTHPDVSADSNATPSFPIRPRKPRINRRVREAVRARRQREQRRRFLDGLEGGGGGVAAGDVGAGSDTRSSALGTEEATANAYIPRSTSTSQSTSTSIPARTLQPQPTPRTNARIPHRNKTVPDQLLNPSAVPRPSRTSPNPPPRIQLKEFVEGSSRDGQGAAWPVGKSQLQLREEKGKEGREERDGSVTKQKEQEVENTRPGVSALAVRSRELRRQGGVGLRVAEVMKGKAEARQGESDAKSRLHPNALTGKATGKMKPSSSSRFLRNKETIDNKQDTKVRRLFDPALFEKLEHQKQKYDTPLHRTIMETEDVEEAWEAFERLAYPEEEDFGRVVEGSGEEVATNSNTNSNASPPPSHKTFTKHHLRRLARLLTTTPPPTRTSYLRLRSVVAQIRREGGRVPRWIWNALVKLAGRGWRKVRVEEYKAAVGVVGEMVREGRREEERREGERKRKRPRPRRSQPDEVTYATLIDIASRTLNPSVLRHAFSLISSLPSSSPTPRRIPRLAHLSTLRLHTHTSRLPGIHTTLHTLRSSQHPLVTDGLNALLHAFSLLHRPDLALRVYTAATSINFRSKDVRRLGGKVTVKGLDGVGVVLDGSVRPDWVTHVTMVQVLAYHGDVVKALVVFMEVVGGLRNEVGTSDAMVGKKTGRSMKAMRATETPDDPTTALARISTPVFRALFLGFYRHARAQSNQHQHLYLRLTPHAQPQWTPAFLQTLLDCLFSIPPHPEFRLDEWTAYWILSAIAKVGGLEARPASSTGIGSSSDSALESSSSTDQQPKSPVATQSRDTLLPPAHSKGTTSSQTHIRQHQREVWSRLQERFGVEAKGRLAKLVQSFSS